QQCMHCHGVSGDGDGPTATFLWPPPRDYRPGIFKFTSTSGSSNGSKPTRDDLRRTLRMGIPNTSMPSFTSLLSDNEIEQVIDYVMFLSMRGETELNLISEAVAFSEEEADTAVTPELARQSAQAVFDLWKGAKDNVIEPKAPRSESTRASILR